MTPLAQNILAHARVADMHAAADELAAAVQSPPRVVLTRDPKRDRRILLALLAYERRRNATLVDIMRE